MNGIVLLDEDAHRTLYDSQRSSTNESVRTFPATYHQDYTTMGAPPRREPQLVLRTDFTNRVEPPRGDYRTDFMTHHQPPGSAGFASPRHDLAAHTRPVPRSHDLPYKREPRTDFTNGPRTDFTSGGIARGSDHSGTGKPSNLTHRSSNTVTATVDYTTLRDGGVTDDLRADSYPILRDDPNRASSTGSTSHHAPDQYAGTSSGLKSSVRWILTGLMMGLVLGVLFSQLKVSPIVAQWVALPGDLFIRALKCLVVPYVFCSVAVAVGDIVFVGKISVVGVQTAKVFVLFWVCTVAVGITVSMLFRPLFRVGHVANASSVNAFGFTCADKHLLTMDTNGSVVCATNAATLTKPTTFTIKDKNSIFATKTSAVATVTLSDQIMTILTTGVSDNILGSLANSRLLSIITFSMLLGSVAGRGYFTKTRQTNYLYLSLLQLRNTFFLLMEWTIWLSPVAIVSIIAGTFATNQSFTSTFSDVYPLLLAALTCAALQALVVYPLLVFLLTRCNPYSHMQQMLRAYTFAFASASSLATMPVTLSCVHKARMCSQSVGNFVISIGVVSGLSGMGWYLPIALTFLAEASGNGDQLTAANILGMAALSLLACVGSPPLPASGLVVISTAYATLLGPLPKTTFAMVVAVDFIIDRISTVCNVNDDVMALKIISETTDETVAQDHLGERF